MHNLIQSHLGWNDKTRQQMLQEREWLHKTAVQVGNWKMLVLPTLLLAFALLQ